MLTEFLPGETYGALMNLYKKNPKVDAIFISGGCLRTLEMITTLEKDTGLPSSLQYGKCLAVFAAG